MDVQQPPALSDLSDLQRRGRACVACGVALDNATAVDLGSRPDAAVDHRADVFPRACPSCAAGGVT
ncbi:hypothetical protein ACFYO9_27800 [Streptomyces sp. NPDC005863]|uniref:hypothetical protein n=1 Tax=unclassified Streptomyces TaxID=2593676 RepID=UPI0033C42E9B